MAEVSGFFQSVGGDRKYGADFLAARESALAGNGIHNTELGVSAPGGMTVSVAAGRAWINGYFYRNDTPLTLPVSNADGVLGRIDNVVVRFSADARSITAQIVQGEFSSSPAAPVLVREGGVYDLKLAEIRIPAGTTEITLDLITDTRPDGAVCGIVSGTMGQIDYGAYYRSFQASFDRFMETLEGTISEDAAGNLLMLINQHTGDSAIHRSITWQTVSLLASGWNSSNQQTVSVTGITASGSGLVRPGPAAGDSYTAYIEAGIKALPITVDGKLIFRCESVPEADIEVIVEVVS